MCSCMPNYLDYNYTPSLKTCFCSILHAGILHNQIFALNKMLVLKRQRWTQADRGSFSLTPTTPTHFRSMCSDLEQGGMRIVASSNLGFSAESQMLAMCLSGPRPHVFSEMKLLHTTRLLSPTHQKQQLKGNLLRIALPYFFFFFEAIPPDFWSYCLDTLSSWQHESTLPSACSLRRLQGTPQHASQKCRQHGTSASEGNKKGEVDKSVSLG